MNIELHAFFLSTGLVALAEMGDKTQLLALLLAARYRKPAPIIMGILIATLLNHGLAVWLGVWVAQLLGPPLQSWILGLGFIAIALWTLIPDKSPSQEESTGPRGIFVTTLIAFFLAEIGDKTQLATVGLAAEYGEFGISILIATTLGMLLANVPAVLLGNRFAQRLPLRAIRWVSASLFAILGILILLGWQYKLHL
jgi:Ca2+/H+ antiporter, TMEM165/GDT1 family